MSTSETCQVDVTHLIKFQSALGLTLPYVTSSANGLISGEECGFSRLIKSPGWLKSPDLTSEHNFTTMLSEHSCRNVIPMFITTHSVLQAKRFVHNDKWWEDALEIARLWTVQCPWHAVAGRKIWRETMQAAFMLLLHILGTMAWVKNEKLDIR